MMISAFALSAGVAYSQVVASEDYLAEEYASDMELEMLDLLNAIRAEGVSCTDGSTYAPNATPLVFDCRLWRAARVHADWMAETRYSSHTWADGTTYRDRAGWYGVSASGENLTGGGGGSRTAQGALDAWLGSSGHCRNMMKASNKMIGAAMRATGKADFADDYIRWVQVFAQASQLDELDQSCIPTDRASNAVVMTVPTASPTPSPTSGTTPRCAGSPAQRCKMLCPTKRCDPGQCWMRVGTCCTRKCQAIA